MDLNPTPEQKMLRDAAQKYFRAEYRFDARAKRLASADAAAAGAAHWTRFAEFGWLGLGLPEALGGTGLGLAIVKHIVNRHRGRLKIESEPGKGSKFIVILPEG